VPGIGGIGWGEVTDNHHIDAPTVERWLADHPPAGVDTRQNTIFFVNWYGRPDFKFHVYTKTGEPEPDTGFNFGVETESRKLIAWGGTTPGDEENGLGRLRRVWFYDLSAGPESWTDNWNDPDAGRAADELAAADRLLGAAKAAFRGHRYLAASFLAKGAYEQVRRGARQAGVPVVGSTDGWQVDEPGSDAAAAARVDDAATVDHLGPRSHRLRD
jgi:hypothetical protein